MTIRMAGDTDPFYDLRLARERAEVEREYLKNELIAHKIKHQAALQRQFTDADMARLKLEYDRLRAEQAADSRRIRPSSGFMKMYEREHARAKYARVVEET